MNFRDKLTEFWKSKKPMHIVLKIVLVSWLLGTLFGINKWEIFDTRSNVTMNEETALKNLNEDSSPLGIYDVKFEKRASGLYLVGKIKKNSTNPEKSYVSVNMEMYTKKGDNAGGGKVDSRGKPEPLLGVGDVFDFEIKASSDKAEIYELKSLEEVSLEQWRANDVKDGLSQAESRIKNKEFSSAKYYLDKVFAVEPENARAKELLAQIEKGEKEVQQSPQPTKTPVPTSQTAQGAQSTQLAQDFVLVNKTGVDIYELYISPTKVNDWEEDILNVDILEDGSRTTVTFHPTETARYWDLMVVDAYGNSIYWEKLDLYSISTVILEIDEYGNGIASFE